MPLDPEITGFTITAAGKFTPEVFQPDWMMEQELLPKSLREKDGVKLEVVSPAVTSFTAGWFRFVATPNQIQCGTHLESALPNLRDITCGDERILLGADLEETGDANTGWSVVVSSPALDSKARIFKVPHHGSKNGQHDKIWSDFLVPNPYALITPFSSTPLPTQDDIKRIKGLTALGYITKNPHAPVKKIHFSNIVDKTIAEVTKSARMVKPAFGRITMRKLPGHDWTIQTSASAGPLP